MENDLHYGPPDEHIRSFVGNADRLVDVRREVKAIEIIRNFISDEYVDVEDHTITNTVKGFHSRDQRESSE